MKRWTAFALALCLTATIIAEDQIKKEVAAQWTAYSDTVRRDTSDLANPIDVNFDGMGGQALLFTLPPSGLWGLYYPKEFYASMDLDKAYADIKKLGATGVIFNGGFTSTQGVVYGRAGKLPPRCYHYRGNPPDDLVTVAKACQKAGMDVWLSMHGMEESRCSRPEILKDHQGLYAKDAKGNVIPAGAGAQGGIYDILSDEVFQFLTSQIDDIIAVTEPYGSFKGFFWDEFWFNYQRNTFGAYYDRFAKYCLDNFAETPPEAVKKKFEGGVEWHEPADKWWRRYVLWRETLTDQFERRLVDYVNRKGYKVINQRLRRYYPRPYAWTFTKGMKNTAIGDGFVQASKQNICTDNAWTICWVAGNQGMNNARMVTGRPTCAFTYWYIDASLPGRLELLKQKMGEDYVRRYVSPVIIPRMADEIRVLFRNVRRWDGAKSLASSAVLMSERGDVFTEKNPVSVYDKNEKALLDALSYRRPTRIVDAELLVPRLKNFKTALVSGPALERLDNAAYAALTKFVEEGGTLLAIEPKLTVGGPDGSDAVDKTSEFFGVHYGKTYYPSELTFGLESGGLSGMALRLRGQICAKVEKVNADVTVLASLNDGGDSRYPGIVRRKLGKGDIIGIYFNLNNLIAGENEKAAPKVFTNLLMDLLQSNEAVAPPIAVRGDIRVEECLKKGDDIGITFYSERALPASAMVTVNPAILDAKSHYLVNRRARGVAEPVPAPGGGLAWTVEGLAKPGFPVTVTPGRGYELIEIEKTDGVKGGRE